MLIVQKYGGTSVGSVARIHAVAEQVARARAAGHQVAVVVSAMGDSTDRLIELAREVSPEPDARETRRAARDRRDGLDRAARDGALPVRLPRRSCNALQLPIERPGPPGAPH